MTLMAFLIGSIRSKQVLEQVLEKSVLELVQELVLELVQELMLELVQALVQELDRVFLAVMLELVQALLVQELDRMLAVKSSDWAKEVLTLVVEFRMARLVCGSAKSRL